MVSVMVLPFFPGAGEAGAQTAGDISASGRTLTLGGQPYQFVGVDAYELATAWGAGQCGTQGPDYQTVIASPGIDVASYHDYYGTAPLGGDQWNGIAVRLSQAQAVGKPIIGGEVGITAGVGASGCESGQQRVTDMARKFSAQFGAGSSGELIWNWSPDPLGGCSFNTTTGDALMTWMAAMHP